MSETKQLPRLAVAGPTIAATMGTRNKKHTKYPIGNIVPAILPTYSPKHAQFQRPGDVYRPLSKSSSRQTPRPLGLIPERQEHMSELPTYFNSTLLPQPSQFRQEDNMSSRYNVKSTTAVPAARLKPLNGQFRAKSAMTFGENIQSSTTNPSIPLNDPDYMDMLERLNVPLSNPPLHNSPEYTAADIYPSTSDNGTNYHKERHSVCLPVKLNKTKKSLSTAGFPHRRAYSLRPHSEASDSTNEYKQQHSGHSIAQYISFVEQASLNHRHFGTDKRDGLDYIPCERCRLRGGRCSNCKTIRIGGGYLILDDNDDDKNMKRGHNHANGDHNSQASLNHLAVTEDDGQGRRKQGSFNNNQYHSGKWLQYQAGIDDDGAKDNSDGHRNYQSGIGSNGSSNADNMNGSKISLSQSSKTNLAANRSSLSANRSNSSGLDGGGSNMGNHMGLSQDGIDSNMDVTDGLDQVKSSHSRPGSSRPLSSRPMSSRNRGVGNRRSLEGRNRKGTSMEKSHGGRRQKKSAGSDGSSDENDDDETKKRRKKKDGNNILPDIDEHNKTKKKKKQTKDIDLYGDYGGEDSEPEQSSYVPGPLYKFKSKEDNVKAMKCTLKELQAIDPLDYLAKYCIIDQSKIPNYRRVYDNVDRDEDDEIDINELDFALKAVNYELISDAEVDYVHQILELSSRYKLNFHLFSVIAALSEKVVALEDMVKKLINKMDLKALETKMKKCKELFYLLDDMDSGERGGVVTIASLAVELQAGGLTEEHVEFVVDRLNHENKGLVEFLDYLTYVPLFVEIHDSVCGNPLDFTRTK